MREIIQKDKGLKGKAKEAKAKQNEDIEKELAEEQEDFERSLAQLGEAQPDLKSIAALVQKLKKDEAIIKTAAAVGNGGFRVAAVFFEPLAAAGTLITFLTNARAAVNRAIQMKKWADSNKEAEAAASAYQTSIANFLQNQKEQFAHY